MVKNYDKTFSGFDVISVNEKVTEWQQRAYADGYMTWTHSSYLENGGYEVIVTSRKM